MDKLKQQKNENKPEYLQRCLIEKQKKNTVPEHGEKLKKFNNYIECEQTGTSIFKTKIKKKFAVLVH